MWQGEQKRFKNCIYNTVLVSASKTQYGFCMGIIFHQSHVTIKSRWRNYKEKKTWQKDFLYASHPPKERKHFTHMYAPLIEHSVFCFFTGSNIYPTGTQNGTYVVHILDLLGGNYVIYCIWGGYSMPCIFKSRNF